MLASSTVRLLEADPDLGSYLSSEDHEIAGRINVRCCTVDRGDVDIEALLGDSNAFGAIVLDRILLHRLRLGEQSALRLVGPGDMIVVTGSDRSSLLDGSSHRASGPTRLALLDDRLLIIVHRFPGLLPGLQARMAEQQERLAIQLLICQLPRVEDRVLSILWLLAESWGRVTASGTSLPLALTHDAIGELIGAKRPTVTLALKQLSAQGALVRQEHGWLLLERAHPTGAGKPLAHDPELIMRPASPWLEQQPTRDMSREALDDAVQALDASYRLNVEQVAARLDQAAVTRRRSRQIRERIERRRLTGRAPS